MNKKRIIIDTDPATGVPLRDVDDGLAILFILASPFLKLEGITINFGNVKAPVGCKVARKILEVVDKDVPVFLGAHSKRELGEMNEAVEFMIETVNNNQQ